MASDVISYHLPLTHVRIAATVTETTDTILDGQNQDRKPDVAVTLVEIGDHVLRKATISSGLLRDVSVSFKLTDDGRLVSSGFESNGQLGRVLIGIVTGVSAVVGGAIGIKAPTILDKRAEIEKPEAKTLEVESPEDKAKAAYKQKFEDLVSLRTKYVMHAKALDNHIENAVARLNETEDDSGRRDALRELSSYRSGSAIVRDEIERLDNHFNAWRATTIKSRVESHERLLSLEVIREAGVTVKGDEVSWGDNSDSSAENKQSTPTETKINNINKIREIWDKFGVLVIMDGAHADIGKAPDNKENHILFRIPRRVTLSIYQQGDDGKAMLVDSRPYMVMDSECRMESIEFRKSLWAKRAKSVEFSTIGALAGVSTTRASAGAAISDVVQSIPGAAVSGLNQSREIFDSVEAVRSVAVDQQISRLKKRIELKQQEITESALLATEGSAAELERLRREADILEQRKTIAGYAGQSDSLVTEIATIKQQLDLLISQQALSKTRALF